ncbi:YaaL family protein [Crassaminicella indica]|uniref:YaaL family protein n=1 Tax=Crassaminicella indica TaxID=2855394 RepID=A0ABX8RJR9_9CLOT|nr:YaaL family protein [Crassaminicella indica]QXM07146.1 YaaL family protein [Crassaminicella indica]
MRRGMNRSARNTKSENSFFSAVGNLYAQIINGEAVQTEEDKMIHTIKEAHEEWRNAEKYFQDVTDPDLIDYAIYRVEAAKTRYTYLLKVAREMGIKSNIQ